MELAFRFSIGKNDKIRGSYFRIYNWYDTRILAKKVQIMVDYEPNIYELYDEYDKYISTNILAWCEREKLPAIDLGGNFNHPEGYLNVDYQGSPDIRALLPELPFNTNSIGVIRAVDFLEHVADKITMINEIHRVLVPGGMLLSETPSTDGRGAFQDPTHVAYYNENSFWYYTNPVYAQYVPNLTAYFRISHLLTYFPSSWHENNKISYVRANLIAIKG